MNSREVVALMGAHSFGKMRTPTSLFHFGWTSVNQPLFNNRYYRILRNDDSWYIPTTDCNKIGNAVGDLPQSKMMIKANGHSIGGGPIQFMRYQDACPDCEHPDDPNYGGEECCAPENIPEGLICNPECQKYRIVEGSAETMLNCDMGLYLDF